MSSIKDILVNQILRAAYFIDDYIKFPGDDKWVNYNDIIKNVCILHLVLENYYQKFGSFDQNLIFQVFDCACAGCGSAFVAGTDNCGGVVGGGNNAVEVKFIGNCNVSTPNNDGDFCKTNAQKASIICEMKKLVNQLYYYKCEVYLQKKTNDLETIYNQMIEQGYIYEKDYYVIHEFLMFDFDDTEHLKNLKQIII